MPSACGSSPSGCWPEPLARARARKSSGGAPCPVRLAAMSRSISSSPFVGFAPWIIFSSVVKCVGWEIGALAGLVSSAILSYPSFERGTLKILDYVGFVFFAALVVLGLFLDRAELDWVDEYSTVISMGAIAV